MTFSAEINPLVAQHAVADIVDDSLRRDDQIHESVHRVYSTNLMRVLDAGLVEWPDYIFVADIMRTRPSDGRQSRNQKQFMLTDDHLVPLATHTQQDITPEVYSVDHTGGVIATELLSKYIVGHLPEVATLTRALSIAEARKFIAGDSVSLGSSCTPYWENVLHTAVHNVSSEFEGLSRDDYGVVIEMHIPKTYLASLVDSNGVRFDSYDFIFKERADDSPLPFDAEAAFSATSLEIALRGYRQWVDEEGSPYYPYPFQKNCQ